MLARAKQLAAEALDAFRDGARIPVRGDGPPLRSASAPRACAKYKLVPRSSEVLAIFEVPGARAQNTELYWDREFQTLSMRVTLTGKQNEDLGAVLAFGSDVDGARGEGTLKGGSLLVRLPRREVDTFTALPQAVFSEPASLISPLYA